MGNCQTADKPTFRTLNNSRSKNSILDKGNNTNNHSALNNYNNSNASVTKFDIYLGENETIPLISNSSHIEDIRCSYIKPPAVVQYLSDVGGNNVDSDLPDQLQVPMLKHAVDLYRTTMQGSIFSAQQNQQDNNREIARNNARPDNEGYQSQNQ